MNTARTRTPPIANPQAASKCILVYVHTRLLLDTQQALSSNLMGASVDTQKPASASESAFAV